MRRPLVLAVIGISVILIAGGALVALRATGAGDEVGDFIFGSESKATPTRTPRPPRPTPKPLPPNVDISFTGSPRFTQCDFNLRFLECNRTSTGAVAFDLRVENNSDCRITDVEVHLELMDGNGNVVSEIDEAIRDLDPKEVSAANIFTPPPESAGWELYDSNVTWQWDCSVR